MDPFYLTQPATWRTVKEPFDTATVKICDSRKDVIVLTADLATYVDLFTLPKVNPRQFLNVGMAEQNLMSVAGGLAKAGLIPIATTFAVYATRRAYDQMVICMGTGSRGVVVGFTPGITSPARIHHQSIDDLAMMRAVPNACVIDPADATEFTAALWAALDYPGLVYMRGHRSVVPELFDPQGFEFKIGATRLLLQDGGIGIVCTGHATQWALEASEHLQRAGVKHSILHVPTLKPVDAASVAGFCNGRRWIVTIENHNIVGGLGSLVAEVMAEQGTPAKLKRLGVPDAWAPGGSLNFIRGKLDLSPEQIAKTIGELA